MNNNNVVLGAWRAGHETWPAIQIAFERFEEFVRVRDPAAVSRFPTDLYLAAACEHGDPAALAVFEREILAPARGAISAIDASSTFVDEVFQRLRTKLLVGDGDRPRIVDYTGRGPLRAWIGISAARAALMLRRSQKRQREVSVDDWTDVLAMMSTSNPELDLLKQQYASAFSQALRDAAARLESRMRAVLRMSTVDGLSIDEIGAVYGVHRATAARWIQRACNTLYGDTRTLMTERLALTATELDRVTALIQSQLSINLSQLLPAELIE